MKKQEYYNSKKSKKPPIQSRIPLEPIQPEDLSWYPARPIKKPVLKEFRVRQLDLSLGGKEDNATVDAVHTVMEEDQTATMAMIDTQGPRVAFNKFAKELDQE